ncbi:MAG TPA: folylpolyglutamate synthase/dihydrofolate synthase family protein [Bacteroidales bacterium]|nr:folylpolyglutamate synthase/dihydrofolate synthase family protein [Bacteroidales bacterium]
MTYKQTLDFLFSQLPAYHRIGKAAYKNNLDNSNALDSYFGHPHSRFRTIHVAGTNGKGSVSHMIASVLQEAGYKVGLYTSPHLRDFRERIRINGKMIPKKEVTDFVIEHRGIIESLKPSFFEMAVAMAFDYFAREEVAIAVIEVGLGGRLDSTNIITPVLSVITNIGHDHMDILGNTLRKVAAEKAGIIKHGIPVVIGETQEETRKVFEMAAAENESQVFFADDDYECRLQQIDNLTGERQYYIRNISEDKTISGSLPLGGDYQANNLKTVFQAFSVLRKKFNISDKDLVEGIRKVISNTGLQGRWQVLRTKPLVICDTGHNKEGLEFVARQLMSMKSSRLRMVIGFVSDKDLSLVFPLLPKDAEYYFTKASIPRALDEKTLKSMASESGLYGNCYPTVRKALNTAIAEAGPEDLIFVGGSTFVVAEVI